MEINKIPKIIHLCWLSGDPYPEKIAQCISTWKKHLPDYEIMLWDTKRFDVNSTPWTKEAFEAKKYAFVADYIRFYAVYNYGGIYLDSDVEVLKSFDRLLRLPYFIGKETNNIKPEVAVFGAEKHTGWVKDCLDFYKDRHFIDADGNFDIQACPIIMNKVLADKYQIKSIDSTDLFDYSSGTVCLFPRSWFCAHVIDNAKQIFSYEVTNDTYAVHHFANSWVEHDKFPGGPLHRLYFLLSGKDWKKHYFEDFHLIQQL